MTDLFSAFATDESVEQEGTKTQLPNAGDTLFIIARMPNKHYSKLIQKQVKMNRAVLDSKGDAAEKASDNILINVMAKTVLLGWEGEISYKGKKYAYSEEAAKMLLAHRDFRDTVSKVASDMETFKLVKDEEDEKN